jgi:hypothetical protein
MKTSRLAGLLIAALASVVPAAPADAQDPDAPPSPKTTPSRAIELTPFISIDSRGTLPIGTAVNFPLGSNTSIEAEFGYRRGEGQINALSSSASLLYDLPRLGRTRPYLAAGAGLAQYGTPIVGTGGSVIGTQPRIAFEVNAGGGLKVPIDDGLGMRTDARWFKSFGRHGTEHWRVSQGVSFDMGKR